jgi:hypothetical protein
MARMNECQAPAGNLEPPFELEVRRVGPLLIVNHFIEKLGLEELLAKHIPTCDRRRLLS